MPRKTDSGNADAMPSIKVFVASTGRPYKPCWSPQNPVILISGGAEQAPPYLKGDAHICKRSMDLLCALARPEYDDIFIVDLSQVASRSEWSEEIEKPGRATKMLSKWFVKFNPSASTIVAHGKDVKLVEAMVRAWSTPLSSPVKTPVQKIIVVGKQMSRKCLESVAQLAQVTVVNASVPAIKADVVKDRLHKRKFEEIVPSIITLPDNVHASVDSADGDEIRNGDDNDKTSLYDLKEKLSEQGRLQGQVRKWDAERGFGFIVQDANSTENENKDVFIHRTNVVGSSPGKPINLRENSRVSYRLGDNDGRLHALEVIMIDKDMLPMPIHMQSQSCFVERKVTASTNDVDVSDNDMDDEGDSNRDVQVADFHFVSVEFSMDPFGKSLVQKPVDITSMVIGSAEPFVLPTSETVESDLQNSEKMATHHLGFGMSINNLIVQVLSIRDVDAMMAVVLADAHGSVEALATKAISEDWKVGTFTAVSGRMISMQGRMVLLIEHARPANSLPRNYASVHLGQRSASERTHYSGCLVVRGSKCLLVHGKNNAVHIPFTEPKGFESQRQAATRAVKQSCKIFAEEFALLHDIPQAVAFGKDGETAVVYTTFLAVATSPPPAGGGGCGCAEEEDKEKALYDWYTFEDAISMMSSAAEKKCFLTLTWSLADAADAGVVSVDSFSAFRPKLAAIENDWQVGLGFSQLLTLPAPSSPPEATAAQKSQRKIKKKGCEWTDESNSYSCCGPGGCSKKGCC